MRPTTSVVDLDAAPFVPSGWRVEEHKKGGKLVFDPDKIFLYLSKQQAAGKLVEGNELRREFTGLPVLNANALDFFLANPDSIPEEWKRKRVFFWGTIYGTWGGNLCVRFLYRHGDQWTWGYDRLALFWNANFPAACVQAST